ncbi:MAG: Mammalian cell entry related domain protein [Limisphaerales bacterium]|nr:MAG: Mammalian cell entry related domain protein [Limisphaerales bacterium]KAG0506893.1 MAG: Mammalian cell entry related domain protein [Limisphaerales bacterium]TXT51801.1 MAG: Mammalian cell entry related domain protein [Limisphaerales bacterium]
MPLQDLTPQLRTRLSRVEHTVGVFVILATGLLLSGFGYYFYYTAKNKGWFDLKAPFYTYVDSAAGFKRGDKIRLMGRDAGEITAIEPVAPDSAEYFERHFVYVQFVIRSRDIGYIWNDSRVRVNAADLLGGRYLEILPGGWNGYTNRDGSKKNLRAAYEVKGQLITGMWHDQSGAYTNWSAGSTPYHIIADESPALTERAEKLVSQIETALPDILSLTNQVAALLATSTRALTNLDARVAELKPVVSNANFLVAGLHPVSANVHRITANLTNPAGSLGTWLLPTNLNASAEQTLLSVRAMLADARTTFSNANATLTDARRIAQTADTNLTMLAVNLDRSLTHLASLTSNLNAQVEANTNLLAEISAAIVHTDGLVQGLKRHWLLRSAFKEKPPAKPAK